MKKLFYVVFVLHLFFATGCAVGPLVLNETARTVGDSKHELIGGYGVAGYVIKWNYGLNKNLDLGIHWESLSIGIRAKYAFLNAKESGWSLATALGTGTSVGGNHYYGDVIGSYLTGAWEPYGAIRVVHVKNDPLDFKDKDTGAVDFTISAIEYDYGQFLLGSRYWFNPHWLLSLEASSLFAISSGFKTDSNIIIGASFGYRF